MINLEEIHFQDQGPLSQLGQKVVICTLFAYHIYNLRVVMEGYRD